MSKQSKPEYNFEIKIKVVRGGFVMSYPVPVQVVAFDVVGPMSYNFVEEVFTTERKVNQRLKEVFAMIAEANAPDAVEVAVPE